MSNSSLARTGAAAAFLGLCLLPQGAQAQGVDSLSLSCAQAQAIVQQNGAAVLYTGPNIYDRYVRDRSFCTWNELPQPAWTATRDNPQCFVGQRCVMADFERR